jgi:hypothetical protein
MPRVGGGFVCEQVVEVSFSLSHRDPFFGIAVGKIAVVIDGCAPSANDVHTVVAIVRYIGDDRPELVFLVLILAKYQ